MIKTLPELWNLIELFEMEPVYVYGEENKIPWYYSTLNFKLIRNNKTLDITISPAYGIIDIWLSIENIKIIDMNLEDVDGMKIEKSHGKEILHIIFSTEDTIQKLIIETKPNIYIYLSKPVKRSG